MVLLLKNVRERFAAKITIQLVFFLCLTQYQLPVSAGGQRSVPDFEKRGSGGEGGGGSEKHKCLGDLKESLPQIFAWGAYYISFHKGLCKVQYDFEG